MPRPVLALLGGLAVAASMPPWGWWPLAFLGLAAGHLALTDASSTRRRVLVGTVFALGWLTPSTVWMLDLTLPGYVVATLVFAGLFGGAVGLVPPRGPAHWAGVGAAVVVWEALRWRLLFGGVPLATLPMSQVGSPFLEIVRVAGPLLLSAVTVAIGVGLAAAVHRRWGVVTVTAALVVIVGLATLVAPTGTAVARIDAAVVQGGGEQRTRADICENRSVFERHVEATELIEGPVDLIVWPENVVNPEPRTVARSCSRGRSLLYEDEPPPVLSEIARRYDAVVVPGWFVHVSPTENVNYVEAIAPDGTVTDRYDKVRLVPFGEYVPLRSLIESFAPDDLPARDVRPGTDPAVLDSPIGTLGVAISWEVFFEDRARDAIGNGGQILLNPTNGSSYWLTIVQTQQVASSRLRAVETGRWVLQAAPTGFSAVIAPDGTVVERTAVSEQAVVEAPVELRDGHTWAVRVGLWPVLVAALTVWAWAVVVGLRSRRAPSPDRR